MSFKDQVAVITGASSGIGRAMAKVLAAKGCKVGLMARREQHLETLVREITELNGIVAYAVADVGDRSQVTAAIDRLRTELGPIDLLIANAGVGMRTTLDPVNVADVETMFRVNVFGVVYAFAAVLPEMLARGRGHLAAVSSLGAYRSLPGESGYCASKAAVNTYLEGLRIHLRGRGILVTTLCPGFIKTPMTEVNTFRMPWLLPADEAAQRMIRALERRRKVYNLPLPTAILMKLSNWLPDWVVARAMKSYNENWPISPTRAL